MENKALNKRPAVFLDRDGTLIKDNGYLSRTSQVEFYRDTFDSLRQLQEKYLLFIVTNQAGIGKGLITVEQVEKVNAYILDTLRSEGIAIQAIYCCPHQESDLCECRKPKTFFLQKAHRDFAIDLKNSFVIGDHLSDVELALNVEGTGVYVLTGHGRHHYTDFPLHSNPRIHVVRNIKYAARTILQSYP